ncbi:hypothetical protein P692DRAFT_20275809 [Suillus brevipes Sb2]|nr:hypothetical protein P692DRAFT_20275809 [Suillus brevipes Sb2]
MPANPAPDQCRLPSLIRYMTLAVLTAALCVTRSPLETSLGGVRTKCFDLSEFHSFSVDRRAPPRHNGDYNVNSRAVPCNPVDSGVSFRDVHVARTGSCMIPCHFNHSQETDWAPVLP